MSPLMDLATFSSDDDFLSDMLFDRLLFVGKMTSKMNPSYRAPRCEKLQIDQVRSIVAKVREGGKLGEAAEQFSRLPFVKRYTAGKNARQLSTFEFHMRRYFETFAPNSGIKFILTHRYASLHQKKDNDEGSSSASSAPLSAVPILPAGPSLASYPTPSPTPPPEREVATQLDNLSIASGSSTPSANRSRSSVSATPERSQTPEAASRLPSLARRDSARGVALQPIELAVMAQRDYAKGEIVGLLKGNIADLTDEEDDELRARGKIGMKMDFSVLLNTGRRTFQLFLGPARFVNHDCNNNVELIRQGLCVCFKAKRPIASGEEILTSYGPNYFENGNSKCLCATCQKLGKGAFASDSTAGAQPANPEPESGKRPRRSCAGPPPRYNFKRQRVANDRSRSTSPLTDLEDSDDDSEEDDVRTTPKAYRRVRVAPRKTRTVSAPGTPTGRRLGQSTRQVRAVRPVHNVAVTIVEKKALPLDTFYSSTPAVPSPRSARLAAAHRTQIEPPRRATRRTVSVPDLKSLLAAGEKVKRKQPPRSEMYIDLVQPVTRSKAASTSTPVGANSEEGRVTRSRSIRRL